MSKILIVEDDHDISKNLKSLLEMEGYEVEIADNGRTALHLLSHSKELPDAILLDLMMPVMDGFEFRELQLKDERLARIPVGIMTAGGQIENKKLQLGALTALKKPPEIAEILEAVAGLCKK